MSIDMSFIELNRASTERMKNLIAGRSEADLLRRVGEHWTVAIVYVHLAFWDRRVLTAVNGSERDGKLFKPELDIILNDISLPLWAAIPPREAVRLGLESAAELDRRLEAFAPALLEEMYTYNKRWVVRALHRNEHLNEAEAALKAR